MILVSFCTTTRFLEVEVMNNAVAVAGNGSGDLTALKWKEAVDVVSLVMELCGTDLAKYIFKKKRLSSCCEWL